MFREDGNVLHFTAPKGECLVITPCIGAGVADDPSGFWLSVVSGYIVHLC